MSRVIFLKSFFLVCFTIILTGLGKRLFRFFRYSFQDDVEEWIFSFGAGTVAMILVSFVLTLFGWLYFWPGVIVLVGAVLISLRDIQYFLKQFFSRSISFSFTHHFFSFRNIADWGTALVVFFLLVGYLETFSLFPTNYDDLDTYFSVPLLYSQYHRSVPFYNSLSAIAGGLGLFLYALLNTLVHFSFVFHLAWLYFVFVLVSLYVFTKKFFSKEIAFMTLLFATFVPWNVHFISTQKVIFMFVFMSILAVFSLFNWLQTRSANPLVLSGIFLGASTIMKLNGLLLTLTIFLFLGGLVLMRRLSCKKYILFLLAFFLFSLPLFAYNMYYYKNPIAPFFIGGIFKKGVSISLTLQQASFYDVARDTGSDFISELGITRLTRRSDGYKNKIVNFFWNIWNITVNQSGFNFVYSEMGPFFLIFLPFFVVLFFQKRIYQQSNIFVLFVLSFLFFILWYIQGSLRPWYGAAFFYFGFIFCAYLLLEIKSRRVRGIFSFFIILFFLRTIFFSVGAIGQFPNIIAKPSSTIAFSISQSDAEPLFRILYFLNSEIIEKKSNAKILMIPESRTAFIQQWDKRVIADHWAQYWGRIVEDAETLEDIRAALLHQKITHIFYSYAFQYWLESFLQNDRKQYKVFYYLDKLKEFQKQYLREVYCEGGVFCIYEIM